MKSQIRTIIIAFVAGLAIELLMNGFELVRWGYGASLSSNPYNGNVLGYWAGQLSSVPLLFVVIAIVATARKAGLRNSIVNGLGAVVGVFGASFVIVCAVIAFAAAYPQKELPFAEAGAGRDSFVRGASDTCAQQQKALPQNKSVPAGVIDSYCGCFGNALADVVTRVDAAMGPRQLTPGFAEKAKAASQKCMRLAQGQR